MATVHTVEPDATAGRLGRRCDRRRYPDRAHPAEPKGHRTYRLLKQRSVVIGLLLTVVVIIAPRLGGADDAGPRSGTGRNIVAPVETASGVADDASEVDGRLDLNPVTVTSDRLCEVIEDHPGGGPVVIPDGIYTACDLSDFHPDERLFIIAETRNGVVVVRQGNEIGETVFRIEASSDVTFIGVRFDAVNVAVLESNGIEFRSTHHSFPIERHPDPTNSWCGNQRGPNTLEIQDSDDVLISGSDFTDVGNDAIRIEQSDHVTVEGVIVTDVWHDRLQSGNQNGECGDNDGSNYHTDGLQIIDGESDDLTIRDSYFGQRLVLTVDGGGVGGNAHMLLERLWLVAELPDATNCVTVAMKVKDNADPAAAQDATVRDVESFCDPSIEGSRHFDVSGSAERLTINGRLTRARQRNADEELAAERRSLPDIADSPAARWRARHRYDDLVLQLTSRP